MSRASSGVETTDREAGGQVDGDHKVGRGRVRSIEAGLRYADHH